MPSTVRHPRRLLAGCAALALAAALAQPAWAETRYALNIPAGSLDEALVALAAQTHQQLLYPPELARGQTAPALAGRFTAEEALARLLGPGADVTRAGPNVLVLKRAPAAAETPALKTAAPGADRPFGPRGEAAPPGEARTDLDRAGGDPPPASPAPAVAGITVTGSHIRGVADGPSPVLVLGRAELERSGQPTLAAALAALPQAFAGTANEGATLRGADRASSNTNYATGISLRGLGADATLVLIDGRRMAGAGSKGDFADLSTIPTAAVERVEILLDGASALYGADAVGGVVNVILRQRFEGAETEARLGTATAGEPFEGRLSQTFGAHWPGGGGFIAYELHHREALALADRPFSASADFRPFGGTDRRQFYAHPGNIMATDPVTRVTAPVYAIPGGQDGTGLRPQDFLAGQVNLGDQNRGLQLLPRQTRHSLYAAARQDLGALQLLADLRYGYRRYRLEGGTPIALITVPRANPYFASPTGAASHQIAYAFADDLPPTVINGSAESLGASLGGEAPLPGGWRADGYLAFAQEIGENRTGGLINSTLLSEATGAAADRADTAFSAARDGYFNAFGAGPGTNSPAVLASIAQGFSHARTRDQAFTVNLKADGTLFDLPGGPLRLALGAQARRETFVRTGATFTSGVRPAAAASSDARREVTAAFAELRAPLVAPDQARPGLERLELSLAGRVERYDDFGTTANPKAGLIWEPASGLTVRASYGTSFRAPALRELRDAERYSPTLLPLGAARVLTLYQSGGNPDLKPETATSWTAGLELRPPALPGLRLAANAFRVRFSDRIDQPAAQNLLGALTDPTLAPFVTRLDPTSAADRQRVADLIASPAYNGAAGSFPPESFGAILDARYVNTATLRVQGMDLTGEYATAIADNRLTFAGNLAYLADYRIQLTPTAPVEDYVGRPTYPARLRLRASLDWSRGDVGGLLALNHVSGSRDATARVAAFTTLDLQARWQGRAGSAFEDVRVLVSVRNLLDEAPPFYDSALALGYDPANADPLGRTVALQLTRRW